MKRIASVAVLAAFIALPALASAQDIEKGKAAVRGQQVPDRATRSRARATRSTRSMASARKLSGDDITKWITAPAEMEAKLAEKPKIHMKAYKLADADLKSLVAYMQSLK